MAPPIWAFQLDNFVPPPHEELVCSICRCVFCNPVECPCRHVFCNDCIGKWIESHRNCPICRKHINHASLRPVNRIIQNLISGLTLRCKNIAEGCSTVITLEGCDAHVKICEFELEDCVNGCGKSILRRDSAKHKQEDCPFRKIECNNCQLNIEGSPLAHDCVTELKQVLKDMKSAFSELERETKSLREECAQLRKRNPPSFNDSYDLDNFWSSCSEDDFPTNDLLSVSSDSSSSMGSISEIPVPSMTIFLDQNRFNSMSSDDVSDGNQNSSVPIEVENEPSAAAPVEVVDIASTSVLSEGGESSRSDLCPFRPKKRLPCLLSDDSGDDWAVGAPKSQRSNSEEDQAGASTSQPTERAAANGRKKFFRRTLNLLEQHCEDSDPEWVPDNCNWSSGGNGTGENVVSSSDDDDEEDDDEDLTGSESSYEVQIPTPTFDLLQRYCQESDSEEDPDWRSS